MKIYFPQLFLALFFVLLLAVSLPSFSSQAQIEDIEPATPGEGGVSSMQSLLKLKHGAMKISASASALPIEKIDRLSADTDGVKDARSPARGGGGSVR